MNILDENIIDSQRQRLRHWRIAVRHMGYDVGRQGLKDQEIIALLHRLRRPTFFTRDEDFYACRLCHARYCLVYLLGLPLWLVPLAPGRSAGGLRLPTGAGREARAGGARAAAAAGVKRLVRRGREGGNARARL